MSLERKLARGFVSGLKQMERNRVRNAKQHQSQLVREAKQRDREQKAREREQLRRDKERSKQVKQQYIHAMKMEVEQRNEAIQAELSDYENILNTTLEIDDYFDLNNLKKTNETHPFVNDTLQTLLTPPTPPVQPKKPEYIEPKLPSLTLIGRKKKRKLLIDQAKAAHNKLCAEWKLEVDKSKAEYDAQVKQHLAAESKRIDDLRAAEAEHEQEINEHNDQVDQFINFLAYGDKGAVKDYIAIVLDNSLYPPGFNLEYEIEFHPATAELIVTAKVSSPDKFPAAKSYKYIQSRDEVTHTNLSKAELKRRYLGTVSQVALRTAHEIFEADRACVIKTVAVVVGCQTIDPATGIDRLIKFIGLTSSRDKFMELKLESVEPAATLKHLNAAVSKNPFELVEVDVSGVRKA